jgi:hypothetical protein
MAKSKKVCADRKTVESLYKNSDGDTREVLARVFPELTKMDTTIHQNAELEDLRQFSKASGSESWRFFLEGRTSGRYAQKGIFIDGSDEAGKNWKLVLDEVGCQVLVPTCNLLPKDR